MPTRHQDTPDPQENEGPKHLEQEGLPVNPYEVLELAPTATDAEIKKAYFQKVREHPPERDPQQFKRVRAAYDALRTPEARAATDLFMLHPPPGYEPYKRPPMLKIAFNDADWETILREESDLDRSEFSHDFRNINL